jgi:hypothetical protein
MGWGNDLFLSQTLKNGTQADEDGLFHLSRQIKVKLTGPGKITPVLFG